MSQTNEDAKLASVFNFDNETLESNRKGQMTKSQRNRILKRFYLIFIRRVFYALLLGYLTSIIIRQGAWPVFIILTLIILGIPAMFFAESAFQVWWALRNDLRDNTVRTVASRVKHGKYTRALYIERVIFRVVPPREFNVFQERGRYRLYYSPRTKVILSAETVDENAKIENSWGHPTDTF
jgi:hypothetical protein